MKKLLVISSVLATLSLIFVCFVIINYDKYTTYTPPVETTKTYSVPEVVDPIISALGIDRKTISQVNIKVPINGEECKTNSNNTNPIACFQPPNTIIFPATMFKRAVESQNAAMAHEYMHYVWNNMSEAERQSLYPYIDQAAANNGFLRDRLKNYTVDATGRYNELHSFACTEMADYQLPQTLRDHCTKWLPNRAALPSWY